MRSVVVDHIGECDADQRWCGVHESYRYGDSRGCGWFLDATEMAGHAATRVAEEIVAAIEAEQLRQFGESRGLTVAAAIARQIGGVE